MHGVLRLRGKAVLPSESFRQNHEIRETGFWSERYVPAHGILGQR